MAGLRGPLVALLLDALVAATLGPGARDCLRAGEACTSDPTCSAQWRTLRQCAAGGGPAEPDPDARGRCSGAAGALLSTHFFGCRCRRDTKEEKQCLGVYWTLHQSLLPDPSGPDASPYEPPVRGPDSVPAASVSAGWQSEAPGANRCLEAAQACQADGGCQRLRARYVRACLRGPPRAGAGAGSGSCARARCRRALRRFFGRLPPALTHRLLFCPCRGHHCAERRRQTIVPACSYYPPAPRRPVPHAAAPEKPNCLHPRDACRRTHLCRSRLADFQALCQPSPTTPTACLNDDQAACRRAYVGLLGTPVTPNYVDNASSSVAPWCGCGASGNRHDECQAFLHLFTRNPCLQNAIEAFGDHPAAPLTWQRDWGSRPPKGTRPDGLLRRARPTQVSRAVRPPGGFPGPASGAARRPPAPWRCLLLPTVAIRLLP
ncbi:GDNF family receptor alpha-4 [Ornithorhynchus anatinus]|uniref:GDNF family receptor alpha-4 n=1 Tax=Ornithorhynchus anatinus TaxID=9258 RepID=UPI0010A77D1E|nr:GDNF family receptor alpha-4 [Ornithorhynchus anatinus]